MQQKIVEQQREIAMLKEQVKELQKRNYDLEELLNHK